ncbi:Z-ring associated ZapG family protein [Candidatus Pseudomonas adelgestsugas]|uniref:Z-ring associated protein G n=1 Tax=Candidatus Pseudomonas adelgestsugas TaxID=1302376 RepID=A0ABX5R984_9PSED|nr:DUF1043 family protein [Candidatus Pseudomonas adelgestsugas]QAX81876.1 hypothetical protein C3B55_00542 [Candidatus Pseudomonas adelgestsugas]
MEHSFLFWLLLILAMFAGVAIGFLIARLLPNAAPNRTKRQLDDIQERFDSYQNEVVTHFTCTATMVKKLIKGYQEVQDHLTDGAARLAIDDSTHQRLLATLDFDAQKTILDRLTPPRDYAPKVPNSLGMLDEYYGFKK